MGQRPPPHTHLLTAGCLRKQQKMIAFQRKSFTIWEEAKRHHTSTKQYIFLWKNASTRGLRWEHRLYKQRNCHVCRQEICRLCKQDIWCQQRRHVASEPKTSVVSADKAADISISSTPARARHTLIPWRCQMSCLLTQWMFWLLTEHMSSLPTQHISCLHIQETSCLQTTECLSGKHSCRSNPDFRFPKRFGTFSFKIRPSQLWNQVKRKQTYQLREAELLEMVLEAGRYTNSFPQGTN